MTETTLLASRPASVGAMLQSRSPPPDRRRPSATSKASAGSRSPGRRPRTRSSSSRPACSPSASSPRTGSPSPPAPGSSGSWPTWRSCAPAARPRRSTRPPPHERRRLHPGRLGVQDRLRRGRRAGRQGPRHLADLPALTTVVQIDGTDDHEKVIGWAELGAARCRPPRGQPGRGRRRDRRHPAGAPGHPDLHLRHHGPAQGRPAGAGQLDLRGRGGRGVRHHLAPTTCSTSGCR